VLNPDFHGRGYGTEVARAVVDFGFTHLGLHRIEARFMQGNHASRRVMEKVGMTFEGFHRDLVFVKGEFRTVGVCAMTEEDYRRIKG
jgi:ribosomal-protein-alanine N-acetyltransferase